LRQLPAVYRVADDDHQAGAHLHVGGFSGALARMAWAGFMVASQEIAGQGTFTAFPQGAKGGELSKLFGS
jgi:hypothetical protein